MAVTSLYRPCQIMSAYVGWCWPTTMSAIKMTTDSDRHCLLVYLGFNLCHVERYEYNGWTDVSNWLIADDCVYFVCSCTRSTRLEDVLRGFVWHDFVHVQWWEQLQTLHALFQCDTSEPLIGHQGWWLRQEEPCLPSADCWHGSVSYPDQVLGVTFPFCPVVIFLSIQFVWVGALLQATSRVPRWWIGEWPPDMVASCDIYK